MVSTCSPQGGRAGVRTQAAASNPRSLELPHAKGAGTTEPTRPSNLSYTAGHEPMIESRFTTFWHCRFLTCSLRLISSPVKFQFRHDKTDVTFEQWYSRPDTYHAYIGFSQCDVYWATQIHVVSSFEVVLIQAEQTISFFALSDTNQHQPKVVGMAKI